MGAVDAWVLALCVRCRRCGYLCRYRHRNRVIARLRQQQAL